MRSGANNEKQAKAINLSDNTTHLTRTKINVRRVTESRKYYIPCAI